jgi:hypothetical protein
MVRLKDAPACPTCGCQLSHMFDTCCCGGPLDYQRPPPEVKEEGWVEVVLAARKAHAAHLLKEVLVMGKRPVPHAWVEKRPSPAPYCDDCQSVCNNTVEITRAGHHLYVCCHCAALRCAAPPIYLTEGGREK